MWDPAPPPPEDLFLLLFSGSMCVGGAWIVGLIQSLRRIPPPCSPPSTDTGCPFATSLQAQGQGNDCCPVEFLWQEGSWKFFVDLASTLKGSPVMLLSIPYPGLAFSSLPQVS